MMDFKYSLNNLKSDNERFDQLLFFRMIFHLFNVFPTTYISFQRLNHEKIGYSYTDFENL